MMWNLLVWWGWGMGPAPPAWPGGAPSCGQSSGCIEAARPSAYHLL